MPCYLFTYHAYRSWMPDRPDGYVRRNEGILPPDDSAASSYHRQAAQQPTRFTLRIQRMIIDEVLKAAGHQQFRTHIIALDSTHLHVLLSWKHGKSWDRLRSALKYSITRMLNNRVERRIWFSENASRKRVKDHRHFNHLKYEYLPKHTGWKWREDDGLFR